MEDGELNVWKVLENVWNVWKDVEEEGDVVSSKLYVYLQNFLNGRKKTSCHWYQWETWCWEGYIFVDVKTIL